MHPRSVVAAVQGDQSSDVACEVSLKYVQGCTQFCWWRESFVEALYNAGLKCHQGNIFWLYGGSIGSIFCGISHNHSITEISIDIYFEWSFSAKLFFLCFFAGGGKRDSVMVDMLR